MATRQRLLDRDGELAAVASGAAAAAAGDGSLVVVEGAAGTGKTAMLVAAQGYGLDAGLNCLRACCSELERDFAFGAVCQLLGGAFAELSSDIRSELLAKAPGAGIAAGGTMGADDSRPDQAPEVLHGLHQLLYLLAGRQPVQLLVDDAHWADLPSLRFLHYLQPRLEGLALQVVVAVRTAEEPSLPDGLSFAGAKRLSLRPFGRCTVGQLSQDRLQREVPDRFLDCCLHATGGNPLFVLALLDEMAGRNLEPEPDAVRDLGSALVARSVRRRLATLPPAATRYAEALAVLGNRRWPAALQRMAAVNTVAALRSWAALVDAGMLTTATDTGFVHPIVWSSVRDGLAPSRRDALHAQAAALLRQAGATAEETAAHVLRAPAGLIVFAVDTLRRAANSSWVRGAPDVATTYLARALEEPLAPVERYEVLLDLGVAGAQAGDPRAREHLAAAVELAPHAAARAAAAAALAKVLYALGESRSAVAMLLTELDATSDLVCRDQVEDVLFEMIDLDLSLRPSLAGRRPGAQPRTVLQHAHRAVELTIAGVDRASAATSTAAALEGDALLDEHDMYFLLLTFLMSQYDGYDGAVDSHNRAIETAQRRGSGGSAAVATAHRGRTRVYQGRLAEALVDTSQAWTMAVGAGEWRSIQQIVAEGYANALIAAGDIAVAEQVLQAAPVELPIRTTQDATGLITRGRVRSRVNDLHGALDDLLTGGRHLVSWGLVNPAPYPWRSETADVLSRLGRHAEAVEMAVEEVRLARRWGAPRALGLALTTLGRVAERPGRIASLEEAVRVLEGRGSLLALAEALIETGTALHRGDQCADARPVLRRGLALARQCGAQGLARRARTELWATGARPHPLEQSGLSALTKSERRVAELAALCTNREIAHDLRSQDRRDPPFFGLPQARHP